MNKKTFLFLWLLCLVGSWAVIPYTQYLGVLPASAPILQTLLTGTLYVAILYGLICIFSYKLCSKTDLHPFPEQSLLKQRILFGVLPGLVVGLIIYLLDKTLFSHSLLTMGKIHPPFWIGALASLYGAINEEVLLRLFLFTLVYFLFGKMFRKSKRSQLLWATNLFVALLFGLGHLPAALQLGASSSYEISRILLLNGIPSLIFGYLYFSKGLWTAMTAHFCADLVLHVFLV